MKKILISSFLLLAACAQIKPYNFGDMLLARQQFVPGTEDIPVFSGFKPIENKGLAYDSDSGRIVDAYYFSKKAKVAEVSSYYIDTLPQLGWKKTKPFEYKREGEVLKLNITVKG